jgi:hypothetical protein
MTDREQELSELLPVLAGLPWTFAKTMPHVPHEYVIRDRTVPVEVYQRIVNAIRRYGVNQQFGPYRGKYLVIGNHKFWVIWPVLNRDTVLDPADWPSGLNQSKSKS